MTNSNLINILMLAVILVGGVDIILERKEDLRNCVNIVAEINGGINPDLNSTSEIDRYWYEDWCKKYSKIENNTAGKEMEEYMAQYLK